MRQAQQLRELASWYREYAERTENPTIWDWRLRTAEELEKAADELAPAGADGESADAPLTGRRRPRDRDASL